MEIVHLEGAEDTPKIILDKKNGIFEISGRSLLEDSAGFYRPVLDWIVAYAAEPNPATEFVFKLEYLNSASSKQILNMLSVLEVIKGMKIIWYFHEDEEDMEEIGEDFSALVKIPFEFKTY